MIAARRNLRSQYASRRRVGLVFAVTVSVVRSFSVVPHRQGNAFDGVLFHNKRQRRTRIFYSNGQNGYETEDELASFDPFHLQERDDEANTISSADHTINIVPSSIIADAKSGRPDGDTNMEDVWRARMLLVVAAALYGTNFTVVKVLNESVPTGISTTLRFALAALATLPWLIAPPTKKDPKSAIAAATEGEEFHTNTNGLLSLMNIDGPSSASVAAAFAGFEVGAWNSLGYIAQAVGLETTDASKSAFICSLAVVVVPILEYFSGKKLLPREIIGALMAVLGVGFLELGGGGGVSAIGSGDIVSLVQPLAFGVAFWRMEDGMRRFPEEATRMTAAQISAVFVASSIYTFFVSGEPLPVMSQIAGWLTDPMIFGALFWTGCITTALTVYMETLALKTLSAAETTMIFSTEPLWGAAFASLVVGEHLGLGAGMGAALILSGCLFSNMGSIDWLTVPAAISGKDAPKAEDDSKDGLSKTFLGGCALASPAAAVAAELVSSESTESVIETIGDTIGNI